MGIFRSKKRATVRISAADSRKMLLTQNSPFAVQEAYKALRTNVAFSLPGSESKCIGVTSAIRGDGKSTNAINLAISFAQTGKRVILIDCDMRLPTVASKIGIKGQTGLSNLLIGESQVGTVIQRVDELGIDVLPAGTIPPDATRLLESKQMEVFLKELKGFYDYVIVDLPPVTAVADAAILAKYMDGFLLVVRHGQTEFRAINEALTQLRFVNAKVLGFIYHGASVGDKKYYKNYRSYGN